MSSLAPRCPTPHPIDGSGRHDSRGDIETWARDLQIVDAYADVTLLRCTRCGALYWVVRDDSRFAYRNEWRLPDGAEAILRAGEVEPIVALLLAQDLPHGPLWELASARVELLRHLSPTGDDATRIAVLAGHEPLPPVWHDALALLRDELASARVEPPALALAFDLQRDMSSCTALVELPAALFALLHAPPRLLRFTHEGGVELSLAGPPRVLAHDDARALLHVEGPTPSLLLLRADTMIGLPLGESVELDACVLDRGALLLAARREPTPTAPRRIDLRDASLEFMASLAVALAPDELTRCRPRAMAEGWVVSNGLTDAGEVITLCLFDARWQPLALARDDPGPHELDVVDAARLLARPLAGAPRVELWQRRGERLERTLERTCTSHVRIGEQLLGLDAGVVFALALSGTPLWRATVDASDAELVALAACVVIASAGSLVTLEPASGRQLARLDAPFTGPLLVDGEGWVHRIADALLVRCSPSGTIETTPLDAPFTLVGVAGGGVLLHAARGPRHLWIDSRGRVLAGFDAHPHPTRLARTRGGPHVLELDRLRVGRLA
jgi:hypothetical protein